MSFTEREIEVVKKAMSEDLDITSDEVISLYKKEAFEGLFYAEIITEDAMYEVIL